MACNNTKEGHKSVVINPVKPSDEVIAFFEEHLPPLYSGTEAPGGSFFFLDLGKFESICLMINSVEEFRDIASCPFDNLPAIDFESYTLIIGQQLVGNPVCYRITEQNIINEPKKIGLNIAFKNPDPECWALGISVSLRYWGIYPKLQIKPINVNVTYKD